MKYVEIIGYNRANLGKSESKRLRREGLVPAVLYGEGKQVHFSAPTILFKPLVYTVDAHFVQLNIEGKEYKAILQDIQFHPVSENIIHADFLILQEGTKVKMNIPVHLVGNAVGVMNGGILLQKRHTLKIKALPKDMPEYIEIDITDLDFHKAVKVSDVSVPNVEILDTEQASIAVIEVPRALRGKDEEEDEESEGEKSEAEKSEAEKE